MGVLVDCCRTLDQVSGIQTFPVSGYLAQRVTVTHRRQHAESRLGCSLGKVFSLAQTQQRCCVLSGFTTEVQDCFTPVPPGTVQACEICPLLSGWGISLILQGLWEDGWNLAFLRAHLMRVFPQAKAVLKFIEGISEKTLRSTVALTAARGRGKSAALGLAIAGAVAFG